MTVSKDDPFSYVSGVELLEAQPRVVRLGSTVNDTIVAMRVGSRSTTVIVPRSVDGYSDDIDSDGSTIRIYVDGILRPSTVIEASGTAADGDWFADIAANAQSAAIGAVVRSTVSNVTLGTIGQVRIYDRPLTPSEIWGMYQDPLAIVRLARRVVRAPDTFIGAITTPHTGLGPFPKPVMVPR